MALSRRQNAITNYSEVGSDLSCVVWIDGLRAIWSRLSAHDFLNTRACRCVSVPAPAWGSSSRVCRRQRRPRLPVPVGFTKSSMTASAFSLVATARALGASRRLHAAVSHVGEFHQRAGLVLDDQLLADPLRQRLPSQPRDDVS
jgi:hypothetical protein